MARMAVGGVHHETNTFAPQTAPWAAFEQPDAWPGYLRGPEMFAAVQGLNVPIAGAIEALAAGGCAMAPLSWCAAPPSAHVERDAYERIVAGILEDLRAAGSLDGIYLDLHGAMVTQHLEDGEGELLRRIRALMGDRIPIVVSLDYHANVTPEMFRHATAMLGYRTYPHIDMAETGRRAATLLLRLLSDPRPLHRAYRQIDFLIPLAWQCTLTEPAKGIFKRLGEVEAAASAHALHATIAPGFPPADIAQCGPTVFTYGTDEAVVEAAADRLADLVRQSEARFAGRLWSAKDAVTEAIALSNAGKGPVILADIQDNPGAGGTSDTVGILRALIEQRAKGAVIGMIVDPEAARAAATAGAGNPLRRAIGAAVGYAGERPVAARWRVVRVGDGNFTGTGPMAGGARFQMGAMALVTDEDSGVSAVLACKRVQAFDQSMFRHVGVEPATTPILGLKSTVHFRADFEPIAATILAVASPGAHVTDPATLSYERLRPGVRLGPLGPVHAGGSR